MRRVLAWLSDRLDSWAGHGPVLVLFPIFVLFNRVIFPRMRSELREGSGGTDLIDMHFLYTPDQAHGMIASYAVSDRARYAAFELSADLVYPVVYTLLFGLLISWCLGRAAPAAGRLRRLNVVPVGAWLCDLLENLAIVAMLALFPRTPATVAVAATLFTMLKWSFIAVSLAIIVGLAGVMVWRGLRRGKDVPHPPTGTGAGSPA